ncbi:hypothetical protein DM01DRAFT_1340913 [Hesseltinella vesiculosa]|uniref:Uncharacterized protein n=1 Tax=Hesseltinella vesiculosa TaxID=101127 RepID=A0A1X2G2L2_9FUNG|nr:hypothetical protein DM01DRAFT_1340913 [Hesseltinella vesiculosa]
MSMTILHLVHDDQPLDALECYLSLLRKHGALPTHEAMFQLTLALYKLQHVRGLSILHDTLYSFFVTYGNAARSARQSHLLTHMYTMMINLLMTKRKQQTSFHQSYKSLSFLLLQLRQRLPDDFSSRTKSQQRKFHRQLWEQWQKLQEQHTGRLILQLCQEMRQLQLSGSSPLFNTLLQWCVQQKHQEPDLTWNLYHELQQWCTPTPRTYTILFDFARQQQDYPAMLRLLKDMQSHTVTPDHMLINIVMLSLCDQRQYTKAKAFLSHVSVTAPHILNRPLREHFMDWLTRHHQRYAHRPPRIRPPRILPAPPK